MLGKISFRVATNTFTDKLQQNQKATNKTTLTTCYRPDLQFKFKAHISLKSNLFFEKNC